ncbi:MAG: SAM-dependent methyltransferase [Bacteroidales bacterium]|nr:SAM-dependent methyltransferase [Bacteroidales bacterium]
MNDTFEVKSIGSVINEEGSYYIKIKEEYLEALTGLEDYSHIDIIWWGHLSDSNEGRKTTKLGKLFKKGPDEIGVFATRAPFRPNPILTSTIRVQKIDFDKGIIHTPFIDAENETPVLDIKPYRKMERVKNCRVPEWTESWPEWFEDAATYNWDKEINK